MIDRSHYVRLNTLGGVERLFLELTKYQDCLHESTDMVLSATKIHPILVEEFSTSNIQIYHMKRLAVLPIPRYPKTLRSLRARHAISKVKPKTVISWNSIDSEIPIMMSKTSGAKLVHYEHGAAWNCKYVFGSNYLREVDRVICASNASKKVIEERWSYDGEIRVHKNVLLPSVISHIPSITRIHRSGCPFVIGAVGRLVSVKGFFTLIPFINILKKRKIDVSLLIAGEGPEKSNLLFQAKKFNVLKDIHFLGAIESMASFYSQIDLLVIPSLREPFGLVSLEASAYGVPVVATRIDGLPEAIMEGKTGSTIIPSLTLKEYEKEGGNIRGLPSQVYDPESGRMVEPRALDPNIFAETVFRWLSKSMRLQQKSFASARDEFIKFAHALIKDFSTD